MRYYKNNEIYLPNDSRLFTAWRLSYMIRNDIDQLEHRKYYVLYNLKTLSAIICDEVWANKYLENKWCYLIAVIECDIKDSKPTISDLLKIL